MKKITVYTKDYCGYCDMAKNLLKEKGVKFEEIDITSTPEMIHELVEKSGLMTVPQIFVGENCIGGYDQLDALNRSGKLDEILAS